MTLPLGGPMDPVSRRAAEEKRLKNQKKQKVDNKHLEDLAGFLPVADSAAADKLMGIIHDVLLEEIEDFLSRSEKCQIALKILKEFDNKRNIARMAVSRLMSQRPGNENSRPREDFPGSRHVRFFPQQTT